ncbi:TPA: transglutaminase domain-containing protein [Candidatus Woesearchaeota archaeon]|nr:transglutaminase domain-containing protein [Candidatus Woesearchaeota archaeon]
MKKRDGVRILVLGLLIAICATSIMGEQWPLTSESVTVDVEITADIDVREASSDAFLEFLQANLSFRPMETAGQSIVSVETEPKAKQTKYTYEFRWEDPVPRQAELRLKTRMKTKNSVPNVKAAKFPVQALPAEVIEYTKPSELVNSDDLIIVDKAGELAAGKTDLYRVVFDIAEWTRENVHYNLSTMTAKASKSASWVMQNKKGVCDEITTLFMALLRSVGVPARFISGVAYTESPLFPQRWGGHGWAEIYFPGTGWVPFDVTYSQYGWVDATHVKFQEDAGPGEASIKYLWKGRSVDVITRPVDLKADTVTHSGKIPAFMDLRIEMLQDETGIGSWNLAEATVKNRLNSYVSGTLYLARINEMEIEGGQARHIYLKPLEEKKIYWLVKVDATLDRDYVYTFPMTVGDIFNNTAESGFRVIKEATVFTKEEMKKVKDAYEKGEEKIFSKEIETACTQEKENYYTYEKPKVTCTAKNIGNFPFKDLKFCFGGDCSTGELGIAQEKTKEHTFGAVEEGINKVSFQVSGKDLEKTEFYDLMVLDEPEVKLEEYNFPAEIEYQQKYTFEFTLKKVSGSEPVNVTMTFDAAGQKKTVDVGTMTGDKKYVFNLNSEELTTKPNRFVISAQYRDHNGKLYTLREEKEVNLVNVTFGQKMVIFLKGLDRSIRNIFK